MRTDPGLGLSPEERVQPGIAGRHFDDGVSQSGLERNNLFLDLPGRGFTDVSGLSGLDSPADGRAFAWIDFDRDGWRDVVTVNANEPFLTLHRNEIAEAFPEVGRNGFVAIRLEGGNREGRPRRDRSPRSGQGARVFVDVGDATLVREHRAGEGLAAQNTSTLLIGIGATAETGPVRVRWPSGQEQQVASARPGEELHFREPSDAEPAGSVVRRAYRGAARTSSSVASRAGPDETASLPVPSLPDAPQLRLFTSVATWCQACVEEMPELRWLRERFPEEALGVYGVAVDENDTPGGLAAWSERYRAPYPILARTDAPDLADALTARIRSTLLRNAIPASVVTDARGRILSTQWGLPTVSDLRALQREQKVAAR